MAIPTIKEQEKFELHITADNVESTDERFTMDNLGLGDNYKPLDAYFMKASGEIIKRSYSKGERRKIFPSANIRLTGSPTVGFIPAWRNSRNTGTP